MNVQEKNKLAVTLSAVRPGDLDTLRGMAVDAFAEDGRRYGKMPEGIEQSAWHEEGCADGSYLAIGFGGRIAGGARIFGGAEGKMRLGSLFVDPSLHGQGIGRRALELIERRYPQACGWSLDTPAGSLRNQRFYTQAGYVKVGENRPDPSSEFALFDYVKLPLLTEIRDADLAAGRPETEAEDERTFTLRQAARAVLLDESGRMALMHVAQGGYHKLPGGGIEDGEDVFAALRREMREEAGAEIRITGEIGMTAEYLGDYRMKQFSYAYSARVVGTPGVSAFTEQERADGFVPEWVRPEEALRMMESERPAGYSGQSIRLRDLAILRAFLRRSL